MNFYPNYHFGFRAALIVIIWLAFFGTITNASNESTFFGAIVLFLLPLSLDYSAHTPIEKKNLKRKLIGLWSSLLVSAICIGLVFSNITLEGIVLNFWFKLIVAFSGAFYVVLAFSDWVGYSSNEEKQHREMMKKLSRENKVEKMETRVKDYKELRNSTTS